MSIPSPSGNEGSIAGFERGARGITPPSSAKPRQGVFLTDVIVELGFAEKVRIAEAEDTARHSGRTVEQVLLDRSVIDEHQLSRAIAERHGLDHVDLEAFEVDMEAAKTIDRSVAARCGAVPIAFAPDGALIVALQDSFDSLSMRRIETTTGKEVRPAIAAAGAIKRLIERLPDEPPPQAPEPEVPRMKSLRELEVDGPQHTEPERAAEPEPEPQAEPEPDEPRDDDGLFASFDGLSMDLGPTTMEEPAEPEPEQEDPVGEPAREDGDGGKREERLVRELIETKGKVAELERRLEEVVEAAAEAAAADQKLRALRRVVDESRG